MSIALTTAVRSNLIALQRIAGDMARGQMRLATGQRVNEPADNPSSYFSAAALNARAAAFTAIADDIGNARMVLQASGTAIDAMQNLIGQARSVANAALASSDGAERQALAEQFDQLRGQIDQLAADAGFNGVNLLGGGTLTVRFNESGSSQLVVAGSTVTSTALGIPAASGAGGNFATDGQVNAAVAGLDSAMSTLRAQAVNFGSNAAILGQRESFTREMVGALRTGADNLVLADVNEEGANILALRAHQQLATTALSLTAQAQSGVLRLFGLR